MLKLADDTKIKQDSMEDLVEREDKNLIPFGVGDVIECNVISVSGHQVLCDIDGLTYGFVPEKEFSFDTKELKAGDRISAYVMSMENKDGYVVLSLRRADKDRLWNSLEQRKDEGSLAEVKVVSANRGGLMVEAGGIQGFLPVSQLAVEHYPRVEGGDPSKILQKLRSLIGETLTVKIIAADKKEEKLIFSEKSATAAASGGVDSMFDIGEEVEGEITGIAPFGLFVNAKGVEGLIHISEVAWEHVGDLTNLYKVGQKVKAKIVKIDDGKVSLSLKRMQVDPWINEMKKLRVGQKLDGEVSKVTVYGAFVKLPDNLDGLVHASGTGGDVDKVKALQAGDKKRFEVIELKPEARRIGLRLLE